MAASNVVRLPTAAPRKVVQRYNQYLRDYREANPWPGKGWDGGRRERDETKHSLLTRSPELLVVMAMFKNLTDEQKAAVRKTVEAVHMAVPGPESAGAYMIVNDLK